MIVGHVNSDRGSTSVIGSNIPAGSAVLTRRVPGQAPYILRGGTFTVANGGFNREDSEAPFGIPLTYELDLAPTDRLIQHNVVPTPTFLHGAQGWQAGPGRTMTIADDGGNSALVGKFTANGAANNVLIASASLTTIPARNQSYLMTGRFKFKTPDLWLWQDVKDQGTWQHLRDTKANWAAVRSATTSSGTAYLRLFVGIANPAGGYFVPPVQVIVADSPQVNQWVDFSFFFTTAVDIPASARLQFSHGTNAREYAVSWSFDQIGITAGLERSAHSTLYWFDGDSPVPAMAEDYLFPDNTWTDVTGDATIVWDGAVGNSVSTFTGPSKVSTTTTVLIPAPGAATKLCSPVYLNDPVAPARGQWYSLIKIEPLVYAGRHTLMDIIGRAPVVAVSQLRGWATGSMQLMTRTLAERDMALATFAAGRILLWRNPDPLFPENTWYISIGDVTETRAIDDHRRPERLWTVPFAQVERPVGLIELAAGRTWQDVLSGWPNWAGVKANNATWLELLYPSGGFTPSNPASGTGGPVVPSPQTYPSPQAYP